MRTLRKDRRFVVLASKWRCSYCKAFLLLSHDWLTHDCSSPSSSSNRHLFFRSLSVVVQRTSLRTAASQQGRRIKRWKSRV